MFLLSRALWYDYFFQLPKGDPKPGAEPEGKLFAWEMVHPFTIDETGNEKPVVWRSRVDLAGVNEQDRAEVAQQLAELLSVLSFVSKTKAACDVEVEAVLPGDSQILGSLELEASDSTVALVLQTPTLLCDPRFQDVNGIPKSGALGLEELHKLYAAAWLQLSEGALCLKHFFASQSLAGGEYLHRRFRKGKPYTPWLLTDAGSVFVFEVKNAEGAKTKLSEWIEKGLPLPAWGEGPWQSDWRRNPFVRENGFGEIAIHKPHEGISAPKNDEVVSLSPIHTATLEEGS